MIYFTSDTHFGHLNIIKYTNRPFLSVEQMDKEMLNRWNAKVSPDDIVYHLGDFSLSKGLFTLGRASQLHGQINLIKGNHEKEALNLYPRRFASIADYKEITIEGQGIVLFHYGMRTWHHDLRGNWHLYGHSHGQLPAYGKSVDVGVDAGWDFAPISFPELKRVMDKRELGKHPMFDQFQKERE